MKSLLQFSLFLVLFLTVGCTASPQGNADAIYVNGKVYTANHNVIANAFAVSGQNIIFVGSSDEASRYKSEKTQVIDLHGKVVLPGLIDTHIHPIAAMDVSVCDLENKPISLDAMTVFIVSCLDNLDVPLTDDEWFQVELWNFIGGNRPSETTKTIREALDAVSTERPIILLGSDGHHYGVNSAALALGKIDADNIIGLNATTLKTHFKDLTPFVGLGSDGRLNGRINEDYPLNALGASSLLGATNDRHRQFAERMMDVTLPRGITGFLDAAAAPESLDIYDKLVENDALKARVSLALFFNPNAEKTPSGEVDWDNIFAQANKLREKYNNVTNIKANFIKVFMDGVIEGDPLAKPPTLPNAALSRPYLQPIFVTDTKTGLPMLDGYVDTARSDCPVIHPGQCLSSSGVLQNKKGVLTEFIVKADANNYTLLLHAIGDRAVSAALDGIEKAKEHGSKQRHIITHLQLVSPQDVTRIAKTNSYSSFTFAWAVRDPEYDMMVIPFIDRSDGEEGLYDPDGYYYKNVYPARDIEKAGGTILSGSDAPVDTRDPRPFINIAGAVARSFDDQLPLNLDQAISLDTALNSYTINAAKALHIDDIAGSIEIGKRADFIVLDRDIFNLAATGQIAELAQTMVLETWFDGKKVYARAAE